METTARPARRIAFSLALLLSCLLGLGAGACLATLLIRLTT